MLRYFVSLIILTSQGVLLSQSGANLPFSRFGLGDIKDNNFIALRQMGGMGASYSDPYVINIVNPASYAYLKSTAFDVGLYARRTNLSDQTNQVTEWSGNLEYLSLAFPLFNPINEVIEGQKKKFYLGMAFTLMPNSEVSYNITSIENNPNFGEYQLNYQGNGGSYKFLWGNAINYKDFAFGFNLGYLFGNIGYEQNAFFVDQPYSYANNFQTDYRLSGFLWNAGLMYQTVLNKAEIAANNGVAPNKLSIGLHFGSNTSFSTDASTQLVSLVPLGNSAFTDTTGVENVTGDGTLPATFGLGVFYHHHNSVGLGFDYQTTNWSAFRNDAEVINGGKLISLEDAYRVAVGGYWRPSTKSYAKFFQKVQYRYGLFYETEPSQVGAEAINNYGFSCGMGLPFIFQRKFSQAHLGFDFGKRTAANIQENYFQINFSFTYNDDEWFLKRKYN